MRSYEYNFLKEWLVTDDGAHAEDITENTIDIVGSERCDGTKATTTQPKKNGVFWKKNSTSFFGT